MITHEEFESVSFHDNRLWGIEFLIDSDNFESDIKRDIDHICEWIKPGSGEKYKWKVGSCFSSLSWRHRLKPESVTPLRHRTQALDPTAVKKMLT